jgi:glutathione S-transferase
MPTLKLTYFDAPGRAESVRVALRISGIEFEDHRLNFGQFREAKESGSLPLGSVPVLEVDGVAFAQTVAMLRYVAGIGDNSLYPSAPTEALVVDSILDSLNDTFTHHLAPSMFERDMTKKLEMRKELVAGPMKTIFAYVDGLISRYGGPFATGETLTIADIVVALQAMQIQSGKLDGIGPEHLEPYPAILALVAAYEAHPGIVALQS